MKIRLVQIFKKYFLKIFPKSITILEMPFWRFRRFQEMFSKMLKTFSFTMRWHICNTNDTYSILKCLLLTFNAMASCPFALSIAAVRSCFRPCHLPLLLQLPSPPLSQFFIAAPSGLVCSCFPFYLSLFV